MKTNFVEIRNLNFQSLPDGFQFNGGQLSHQLTSSYIYTLMKKIYYLSTCDTCQKIKKHLGGLPNFEQQDIKTQPITGVQLKELKMLAGSYEALFSKRAVLYREMNLKDKSLTEADYRKFILKEYTFLKRPVIVFEDQIFIGNEKATVAAAEKEIVG